MRSPETSGRPVKLNGKANGNVYYLLQQTDYGHAKWTGRINVPLTLALSLALWAVIYLTAAGLWSLRPAGRPGPVEASSTQLARVPVRPQVKPTKRAKVAKIMGKRRAGKSLASRTFATNSVY